MLHGYHRTRQHAGWKSAGMRIHRQSIEELPRAHHAVFFDGTGEGGTIALPGTFPHAGQYRISVLGQIVEIVDQVDQQEFFGH